MSWDFERSSDYISDQGLQNHINFVCPRKTLLPIGSEREIYELNNIVIRNVEIELDDRNAWDIVKNWAPVSDAKLHFEGCRFFCPSSNMWAIHFPWRGSFRFEKSEFCFTAGEYGGYWIFPLCSGSRIWFIGNDFAESNIQTCCMGSASSRGDKDRISAGERFMGSISFISNRSVHYLGIQEGYSSIEISGMNRIHRLAVDLIVDADTANSTSVYFGPREKIDPSFHNCLHHRSLFLTLRKLAAINQDTRQLTVLDRQLERIEYYLNKVRDIPSVFDYRAWLEYWQDRMLFAWRRWSSDFYRSWLRPLTLLVVGYLLINLVPVLVVKSFSMSDWVDLSLRPVAEIAAYEASVARIVGGDYQWVSAATKTFFRFLGLVVVLWIGVWGFALAKSLRR